MTVSSSTNKVIYTANGVVTVFDFAFKTLDESHIKPYLDDVLQTSGFTVNLHSDQENNPGGDVTFDTAPADQVVVAIVREVPLDQQVDYQAYDPFPAQTHEGALDKLTMQNQQQQEELDRTTKASISDDGTTDYTWPPYDAGKAIQWSESSQSLTNSDDKVNDITDQAQQSADDAAASAAAADSSAQDADATLKDFETKYLGAKSSDPTVDNEGNPLIDGAVYWNTTQNRMRVYDLGNTRWTDASGSTATFYQYSSTTAGQTVITGNDDNGENLVYTIGFIQVSYNGQIMRDTDYTETDQNTITLADPIKEDGDSIEILSFGTFDVANTYTKDESDARFTPQGYGGISKDTDTNYGTVGDGAWTTIDNWDEGMVFSPVGVTQDFANSGLRVTAQGVYKISGAISISFTSTNSGRNFGVRLWNDTKSTAGDVVEYFVGRDQAGINISQAALLVEIGASEINDLFQIQIAGLGDSFANVAVIDALYSLTRHG